MLLPGLLYDLGWSKRSLAAPSQSAQASAAGRGGAVRTARCGIGDDCAELAGDARASAVFGGDLGLCFRELAVFAQLLEPVDGVFDAAVVERREP